MIRIFSLSKSMGYMNIYVCNVCFNICKFCSSAFIIQHFLTMAAVMVLRPFCITQTNVFESIDQCECNFFYQSFMQIDTTPSLTYDIIHCRNCSQENSFFFMKNTAIVNLIFITLPLVCSHSYLMHFWGANVPIQSDLTDSLVTRDLSAALYNLIAAQKRFTFGLVPNLTQLVPIYCYCYLCKWVHFNLFLTGLCMIF